MTILVTGATSGLGRNAVEFLVRERIKVRATGRNAEQGEALRQAGIEFVGMDLSRMTAGDARGLLRDVTAVWHCAALSSPWGLFEDFFAANVTATRLLAEAAATCDVRRFIHISTPSIYFDYRHHLNVVETYRAKRFANHYAHTKALAEETLQSIAAISPQTTFVLLRPRGLFGPHDRVILPRILQLLRERNGTLPMPRGGAAEIDLTYVINVVHAMHIATWAPGVPSGAAYNITNQEPGTLADMLSRLLGDELQVRYRVRGIPYALLDPLSRMMEIRGRMRNREPLFTRYGIGTLHFDMTLSNAKAQRELGYYPVYDMAESIRRTADWIRVYGAHYKL